MANITPTVVVGVDGVAVATWLNITEADTGLPVDISRFPDRTVQVTGDFVTAGAITMEGSPDGVTWGTLRDQVGTALVLTDSIPRIIAENTKQIRPRATAGTAVSMTVVVTGVGQ